MSDVKEQLATMIEDAQNIVAFTGAGISTECGIPDFRSPNGFWASNKPVYFDDFVRSPDVRREAWRRFLMLHDQHFGVQPGRGHRALANLHANGKLSAVITQNIDNLHQDSGVPFDDVVELHGNGTYAKCIECGHRHELDWCAQKLKETDACPLCQACGGFVKSATISFGQAMPVAEMEKAQNLAQDCDLMLAIGSSLVVYPAAGIPILARQYDAKLVILNGEPTELDPIAQLVINRDIGDVLEPYISLN